MPTKTPTVQIFLSHAADDIKLVDAFETFLSRMLNITSESIFCSSLEGQGVKKGANFVDAIKGKATEARAVVALLTPAYMESPFCLAELGAAWVLNTHRYPIIVPPNTFDVMRATLLGVVGTKIDDEPGMAQLLGELSEALSLKSAAPGVQARAKREFFPSLAGLQDKIGKAKRVEASIYETALTDLRSANEALDETEKDLKQAREQIKALEKATTAAEAEDIRKKFADPNWELVLDSAIAEVDAIGAEVHPRALRHMILDILGKTSLPDLHDDSYMTRAIEIGVFDTESRDWNRRSQEMRNLVKAMRGVDQVFSDHPDITDELKREGKRNNPDDIRFWEEQLRLV